MCGGTRLDRIRNEQIRRKFESNDHSRENMREQIKMVSICVEGRNNDDIIKMGKIREKSIKRWNKLKDMWIKMIKENMRACE